MRICLILEGAYPYIPGGVSSWTHQLVTRLKNHEFVILTIMPSKSEEIKPHYAFPENVVGLHTIYLDDFMDLERSKVFPIHLRKEEEEVLDKFFDFDPSVDWKKLVNLICNKKKFGNSVDFLTDRIFFQKLSSMYETGFTDEGLNIFFWTFRSMLVMLLTIMQSEIPEADCYHAISTGYAGLLGTVGRYVKNKPFMLTEHGIYAREREEELLKAEWVKGIYKQVWIKYFYFLSIGAYKSADIIISLFRQNKKIQISLGAPPKNTFVVPNGVDVEKFPKHREEHSKIVIGAVLRVVPIKDVKTLIRAFNFVYQQRQDVELLIIGPYDEDKDYYEECRSLVTDLELDGPIRFTGRVDVKEYLPKIDMIILTSISEAQPLVILEAFAARKPVISTDVGSCRELVMGIADDFGEAGLLTKPVSPMETASAVLSLCSDKNMRERLAENGLKRVAANYNNIDVFDAYDHFYRSFE
ncbi:MAG: GT4 family glycosyltransferase PelF [Spirochaetales bacterium]|nr:GT4 family glycosyltransferase PelF [Spirochaetales bacterium]